MVSSSFVILDVRSAVFGDQCDNFKALGKICACSSSSIHQSNEVKTQYYFPMEHNIQLSLKNRLFNSPVC